MDMMTVTGLGMVLVGVGGGLLAKRMNTAIPYMVVIAIAWKVFGLDSAVVVSFLLGVYQTMNAVSLEFRRHKARNRNKSRNEYEQNHADIKQAEVVE